MCSGANYTDRRDRRLSAKLVPTFAHRGSHVVSVTDPYARILVSFRPELLNNSEINSKL
jgi:hypothetical protein